MWCLCVYDVMMSACAATGPVGNSRAIAGQGCLIGATGVAAVGFQRLTNKDVCMYL
jgi:hypothetical protein